MKSAAFDHLTRIEQFGEAEANAVSAASAHLKRACFDGYKLIVKKTRDEYDELCKLDLSDVDCGEFKRDLVALWAKIRDGAAEARRYEGDARRHSNHDQWHEAFEKWGPVYRNCLAFTKNYYESKKVAWAKKRNWLKIVVNLVLGFIIGLLANAVYGHWKK